MASLHTIRFAEKLVILKEVGHGALERIHQLKRIYSGSQRPSFINDPQYKKVTEALTKKFPDFESSLDRTPGWELVTGKAKALFEELEPHYFAIIDAFEFKESALPVLNEISSGTVEMKLDENPTLTTNFLDLFAIYVQLNLLLNSLEERKLILATYYKLYFIIKCINEANYARVANFLVTLDQPFKAMQEEFKSLSGSLGKTLLNLNAFYGKSRNIAQLRKEGALNLILKPEDMAKPVVDKFHYQMPHSSQVYVWLAYGFLLCPETLALPGAVDLLATVLKEGYAIPVFREVSVPLHTEYTNLFKSYKSTNKNLNLSKQKKVISEAGHECGAKGGANRRVRRVYLRQELASLLHLLSDKPALLGPKFQLVLCALSLAKEEVFWFFRHTTTAPPKPVAKKFVEEDFKDNRISDLIYLIDSISTIIKNNRKIVQQYYLEYLRGADLTKLNELCDGNFMSLVGTGPGQICRSIIDEISTANESSNFKLVRLNWFRVEGALASVQSNVPMSRVKEVVDRFNLVMHHTRFVDDIDGLLFRNASLKNLYFFKDELYTTFDKAIKDGPIQPLHALAFVKLCAEFPANVTMFNAEERELIGRDSVTIAEKLIGDISNRIIALVYEVAKQYILYDSQLADVNAAYALLLKKKDYKPPKDFVNPETPGSESDFKRRPQLDRLRLYERNAWQLCSVLNEVESISVFDHKFTPREYLRDKLAENLRKFMRNAIAMEIKDDKHNSEKVLQRPSIFERQVSTYLAAIRLVDNFVDLDLSELIREVFLSELYIPPLGRTGTFDWANLEDTEFKYETPTGQKLIGTIVQWYSDFVSKKLSLPGVCYSSARKGFVSRTGLAFRAEFYADIDELKSLIRIIGPYGMRLIDREVLKYITYVVASVKETTAINKQALDELSAGYHNESTCAEALKKLKDIDNFATKSVLIGNALYFRDILHEATRQTVEEKTPYIYDSIKSMFTQYTRNTYVQHELIPSDALAFDAGLELGTADQALKKLLGKAYTSTDFPLVNSLPYLYAASFSSIVWREAQFKPLIEAHTNNANALSKCINSLIIAAKSVVSTEKNELEIVNLLKTFVEVSSVILLRLSRNTKSDKYSLSDFPSVITFLDRFVVESPLITRDVLENNVPYALLKNHWKTIYTPKTTKKQEVSSVDVF